MSKRNKSGKRPRKREKRRRPKAGKLFEMAVAAVARAFGPGADIQQGAWIDGPDGRRDMDVHIRWNDGGKRLHMLLECKDYNPATTGPVGIAIVDALASKMEDIQIGQAAVISNAGFTEGALHKAGRMGIGALGVMRDGDTRIRFAVTDTIYTRRVKVISWLLRFPEGSEAINGVPLEQITVGGLPVYRWLAHRVNLFLGSNPVVKGSFSSTYHFASPIALNWPEGALAISQFTLTVQVSGAWFAHRVELNSSTAIYDWARRRARLPKGEGTVQIKGVDLHKGDRVLEPPQRYITKRPFLPGEVEIMLAMVEGFPLDQVAMPDLEALLSPDDLDFMLKDLTPEIYQSDDACNAA